MSNKLQEISNLQQEIQHLSVKDSTLITLNWFEKHDKNTIKQLCVTCGGKGFYLLMQGFPTDKNPKGDFVFCEDCEDGFKYKSVLK